MKYNAWGMREDSLKFRVIIAQTSAQNDKQITLDD